MVTLINVVIGTVIAWVLVRDKFWGKGLLEVIIDIPFALPTIVAGLVLLSLYGAESPLGLHWANTSTSVYLALAFVTLPFVVRMVQPVLEELDTDVEEAAASLGASRFTTFWRIILPSLAPAIAAGAALSFARGMGEYGSLVLLSGNLPFKSEVASVRILSAIENDNPEGAAAIAAMLLVVSLLVIVVLDLGPEEDGPPWLNPSCSAHTTDVRASRHRHRLPRAPGGLAGGPRRLERLLRARCRVHDRGVHRDLQRPADDARASS